MTTTLKESRSSVSMENIDEVLSAEDSAKWATLQFSNQYFTPDWLVTDSIKLLHDKNPSSVMDPQFGSGNLVLPFSGWMTYRFGVELDNRVTTDRAKLITGNCVDVFEIFDDLFPDLRWRTFNANPPFAKRWKENGKVIDSTEWTWKRALKHGCEGIFISNDTTMRKLGIDKHPFVHSYTTNSNVWKNCDVVVGVAVWRDPSATPSTSTDLLAAYNAAAEILKEEVVSRPSHNVWLDRNGKLQAYLSTRSKVKKKLNREEILRLNDLKGCHPLSLTTERETRMLLREVIDCGLYTIEPAAQKAIEDALASVNSISCPIMPTTNFEAVAFVDEQDHLECVNSGGMDFTPGKLYEIRTATYSFTEKFSRDKVHYDEQNKQTYTAKHECTLTGQDKYVAIKDDAGIFHRFKDRPDKTSPHEHDESLLWAIFKKPVVNTVAETMQAQVSLNKRLLTTCEMLAGFKYYPGQVEFLSRVACKDYGLVAAETGTGKTAMAISLIVMKGAERALIIAPQGTMRSSEDDEEGGEEYRASQWIEELHKFSPYLQVFELFSMEDYERIKKLNGGVLPHGVYVSYYQAAFQNGARETAPESWDDERLCKELEVPIYKDPEGNDRALVDTIGKEVDGIRCIVAPCMATLIGHEFDMVLCDEAHYCVNMQANVSQMMIRLQPKYRYALTASPIPNIASNIFNLMGWLAVPGWYRGDMRNASWPYAREELGRFESTFLSKERDLTEEGIRRKADPQWRGKCEKTSPIISSPARLLKLLRPTMAFISKEAVNANYKPAKVIDIRVEMGREQAKLYGYFLNRGNIKCKHPLVRARKQIAYLRAICADPAGFEHGGPNVSSNFNPKTIAILELCNEIIGRGEQVVVVTARVGQTNELARRLTEAKIPFSRIDSTIPPSQHSAQSNRFKNGKSRVMLMGIKCAVGHSYPDCPNLIIGSLEYSNGSFVQAGGRVDRVNSKKRATIYCVLHKNTIEETMFDVVACKNDAATICLRGERVPRDFKPVDMSEVLAASIASFGNIMSLPESSCESSWPDLRRKLSVSASVAPSNLSGL